jgi:hypothetical protein
MPKVTISLGEVTDRIDTISNKLQNIRPLVNAADQQSIDTQLVGLNQARNAIVVVCPGSYHGRSYQLPPGKKKKKKKKKR